MRNLTDINSDINAIENLISKHDYSTAGKIGITEIGYGLIEALGTGKSLAPDIAALRSAITRLEKDIDEACGCITSSFFSISRGVTFSDEQLASLEESIKVMATLSEHNLADYGTCEYSSVDELVKAAEKKLKAEESLCRKRMRSAAQEAKMLKEYYAAEREADSSETAVRTRKVIDDALSWGISISRLQKIFEMKNLSSKAVSELGDVAKEFKEVHALLWTTKANLHKLYMKLSKRKNCARPDDRIEYEKIMDILHPFVQRNALDPETSYFFRPWELYINSIEERKPKEKKPKSVKKEKIGLHYRGLRRLVTDVDTVQKDPHRVAKEMTRRGNEYIYPVLEVHGIADSKTARCIGASLESIVNEMVQFWAVVRASDKSDGIWLFEIDDDESMK